MDNNENINNVTNAEKKKNGNKILIACLFVIIAILSAAVVYFAFFKDKGEKENTKPSSNTKENSNTKKENNNTKKEDNNSKTDNTSRELKDGEVEEIMAVIKKYYLLDAADYEKKVNYTNGTLTNNMIDALVSYNASNSNSNSSEDWHIDKSFADEYFKKAFGYTPKNYIDSRCPVEDEVLYKYDTVNERYIYNEDHPGHGGLGSGFSDYIVKSAKKEGNQYILSIIFFHYSGDCSYAVNNELFESTIDECEAGEEDMIKEFRKHKDEYSNVSPFEFVFVKENGNYYLRSTELKK